MHQAKPLWRAVGDELRRRREARGLRQEEVATVARRWGLQWTRSVVAAIEAGRRRLSLEEFLLLPWIAANQSPDAAKGGEVGPGTLGELLEGLPRVQLSPAVLVSGRGLRLLIEGQPGPAAQTLEDPAKRRLYDSEWERLRQVLGPTASGTAPAGTWPAIAENLLRLAAQGEAEQKAAARLGTSPMVVARAAAKRWGRSFTGERDRRVGELHPADASPRTIQALRGHVARALLAELRRQGIARGKPKRAKTGGRPMRAKGTRDDHSGRHPA